MPLLCRCAVVLALPFLFCIDVQKPLLRDAQPYSYNFPGKSRETLFTAAAAVVASQGWDVASAQKYTWVIRTWERRLPMGDQDCECATDAGIVYYNTQNTVTEVTLELSVFDERIVIKASVARKFVVEDPGYGKKFYCVSKGTIEHDLFRKIDSALRVGF